MRGLAFERGAAGFLDGRGGRAVVLRLVQVFVGLRDGVGDTDRPYGRVVVVYRESMAKAVVADYHEVTNGMSCRV